VNFEELFGDQYELEKLVHESDDHALFHARDRVLKRAVALRVHLRPDTPSRRWYERETEVLASLDHPSIRTIYHAAYRGDLAYRVGGWIVGESLAEACARGPRPVPLVLSIARDLLYAMDHAHVRGIVMRRVRPTTLMIDVASRAVVTDLRYSNRVLDLVPEADRRADDPFLAPEVRRGETGDPYADIWAAGSLLYFALTGQTPARDPVPVRELNPRTPLVMERWLMRALERKPSDRYPSAAEMIAALAEWTDPFTEPGAAGPAVILPDTPLNEAALIADRLCGQVHGKPVAGLGAVSVSIGAATFPGQADTLEELIDRADKALYQAKSGGRNRVCVWRGQPEAPAAPADSDAREKEELRN